MYLRSIGPLFREMLISALRALLFINVNQYFFFLSKFLSSSPESTMVGSNHQNIN